MGRLFKRLGLVLLVVLIVIPGIVGCGKKISSTTTTITLGGLGDLTSLSSFAVIPVLQGFQDYIKWTNDENPIPGVTLNYVYFDTQYNPGRDPTGFVLLQNQGAIGMMIPSPIDADILMQRAEDAQIPVFESALDEITENSTDYFGIAGPSSNEGAVEMKWVLDNWNGSQPAKIGAYGMAGDSYSLDLQAQMEALINANPTKLQLVGVFNPPTGTTLWTAEVAALKSCDYIIDTVSGNGGATFIQQALASGYTGKFISPNAMFLTFGGLYAAILTPQQRNGFLVDNNWLFWNDTTSPWMATVRSVAEKYHSGSDLAAIESSDTGYENGFVGGLVMVDAIRTLVAQGETDITGTMLRNEIANGTDIDNTGTNGFGNVWQFTPQNHSLVNTWKMYEYNATSNSWVAVSDWLTGPYPAG